MVETTRSVIYRGVVLFDGMIPISGSSWVNIGPDVDENDLRVDLIRNILENAPDTRPDQYRIVEFSWTDIEPMRIPHPVSLRKEKRE